MKKKGKAVAKAKKNEKHILEFYYMTQAQTEAKALSKNIEAVPEDSIEVWRELNLMEVVMEADSLIFQDASECFIDPLDLEFLDEHHIKTKYQISFDVSDIEAVRSVMRDVLKNNGGFICSDTDDFKPVYTLENIDTLG